MDGSGPNLGRTQEKVVVTGGICVAVGILIGSSGPANTYKGDQACGGGHHKAAVVCRGYERGPRSRVRASASLRVATWAKYWSRLSSWAIPPARKSTVNGVPMSRCATIQVVRNRWLDGAPSAAA